MQTTQLKGVSRFETVELVSNMPQYLHKCDFWYRYATVAGAPGDVSHCLAPATDVNEAGL